MIIKKVMGMVICGVFMKCGCIASEKALVDRMTGIVQALEGKVDEMDQAVRDVDLETKKAVLAGAKGLLLQYQTGLNFLKKKGQEASNDAVGLAQRVDQGKQRIITSLKKWLEAKQIESFVREEAEDPKLQELEDEMKNFESGGSQKMPQDADSVAQLVLNKVMKKIQSLGSEDSQKQKDYKAKIAFKSAQEVRKYLQNGSGEVEIEDLEARVRSTIAFYEEYTVPDSLPSEWRNAKIIEILSEIIENRDQGLTDLVVTYGEEIQQRCLKSKFSRAKLLLMSQCRKWDDNEKKYELLGNRDQKVVVRAIRSLCSISKRNVEEEDGKLAKGLLDVLVGQNEMVVFFPEKYFD
jgi:outer membrane murein-binding lipoprotein Lpp